MEIGNHLTPSEDFERMKGVYYTIDKEIKSSLFVRISFDYFQRKMEVQEVNDNEIVYNLPNKILSSFKVLYSIDIDNKVQIDKLDLGYLYFIDDTKEDQVKEYLQSRINKDIVGGLI